MKQTITLDRKEAEDLIAIFEQREMDKQVLMIPKTDDEEAAVRMLTDKLLGRIP
jgi:hypothetical protein